MNDFIELAKARDNRTVWLELYDCKNCLDSTERILLPKDDIGLYLKQRFPEGCNLLNGNPPLKAKIFWRIQNSVERTYQNDMGINQADLDRIISTSLERYRLQRRRYNERGWK